MKAIYDSGLHHPLVAYLVGLVFLLVFVRRLPFLYGYTVFFLVEILADATATGAWSPVPPGTAAYTVSSVAFIVLGDFRYFLFAEKVTHDDAPFARVVARTAAISIVVPLTTGILTRTVPAMRDDRVLYLVYETALGLLVLGLERFRFARTSAPEPVRVWVHRVSMLFAGLYFGWALCDALILLGIDVAHVLRIVPNVLYYGAFVPFVFFAAPEEARRV